MEYVALILRVVAVASTVGFSVSPGQHVAEHVIVSVVTWPTEQLITAGAQDVMV